MEQSNKKNNTGQKIGSMNFRLRPEKKFHAPEPSFKVPESCDLPEYKKGEETLGILPRVKCNVQLSKMLSRDDSKAYSISIKDK